MPPGHKNDPEALQQMMNVTVTHPNDPMIHMGKIEIPKGTPPDPQDVHVQEFRDRMNKIGGTELQLKVLKDALDGKYEHGQFVAPGGAHDAKTEKFRDSAVPDGPGGDMKIGNLKISKENWPAFHERLSENRPDNEALVKRLTAESKSNAPVEFRPDPAKLPPLDNSVQAMLKQIPHGEGDLGTHNWRQHQLAYVDERNKIGAHGAKIYFNGGLEQKGKVDISGTVERIEVDAKTGNTYMLLDQGKAGKLRVDFPQQEVIDNQSHFHPFTEAQMKAGDKVHLQRDDSGMNFATHVESNGRQFETRVGPNASEKFGDPAVPGPVAHQQTREVQHAR